MKKIWILTAMSEEAKLIIDAYGLQKIDQLSNIHFYANNQIVLALSGVGKIQASIGTTLLMERYQPDRLINIGIAGSLLWESAQIGEVFLIDRIRQHDMYLPFDGEHLSYAKGEIRLPMPRSELDAVCRYWGLVLTWDQFLDDAEKVAQLAQQTQADLVEMEAFAIASVAREYGKLDRLIIIKAISDGADNHAQSAHMDNLDFAMQNSLLVLDEILQKLV